MITYKRRCDDQLPPPRELHHLLNPMVQLVTVGILITAVGVVVVDSQCSVTI